MRKLLLALLVLTLLLPLAAQASDASITNLTYDGVNSSGKMELSWDSVVDTVGVNAQVKGAGITSVWTSIDHLDLTLTVHLARSVVNFTDMSSWQAPGTSIKFRLRVKLQDGSITSWAYVDQS